MTICYKNKQGPKCKRKLSGTKTIKISYTQGSKCNLLFSFYSIGLSNYFNYDDMAQRCQDIINRKNRKYIAISCI